MAPEKNETCAYPVPIVGPDLTPERFAIVRQRRFEYTRVISIDKR